MCVNTRSTNVIRSNNIKSAKVKYTSFDGENAQDSSKYRAFGLTASDCQYRSSKTMCPVLKFIYVFLAMVLAVPESIDAFTIHARDDRGDNLTLHFNPSNVTDLLYNKHAMINMTYNYTGRYDIGLKLVSHNKEIADTDDEIYMIRPNPEHQYYIIRQRTKDFLQQSIRINGIFLGRTYLQFFTNVSLLNITSDKPSPRQRPVKKDQWYHISGAKYPVTVTRKDGPLNHIFTTIVIMLVVLANVAMGCKVDLNVVKKTMKRPIAPCIGLFSQFIIMPMLGFAVSQMFDFEPIIAFALLATGCAPGGGASNTYTFLAGGNVSLSVTMTLISTLAALGLVPLWLFTLGSLYVYRDSSFTVPYKNMILGIVGLIIPVFIGLVIQRKRPAWVRRILSAILPIMVILIVLILSVGIYANLYIFRVFRPHIIIAGALLPNAGFLLGGLLALAFMQTWTDVKTIAIETGLQNTGIPIVLLLSLPKPESDLAIVAPVAAAIFTPIILWIFILIRFIYNRWFRKDKPEKHSEKCQYTDVNNEHFIENIPCRRIDKTPAPCLREQDHSENMEAGLMNGFASGDYIAVPQDESPEKPTHCPLVNGTADFALNQPITAKI